MTPALTDAQPWSPHPLAAPHCEQVAGQWRIAANGTRTCAGGWQLTFGPVAAGQRYRLAVRAECRDVPTPRDQVRCTVHWCELPLAAAPAGHGCHDELLPCADGQGGTSFARELTAPAGATCVTLRLTLRWTAAGETLWQTPTLTPLEPTAPRPPVRVAVVTGQMAQRHGIATVAGNVDFYLERCAAACRAGAKLLVLPEIALQWNVPGHALDLALTADSPEVAVFGGLAQQHGARLCLPLWERDGDAVYNAALLLGPTGQVGGRYHKVHLAAEGEDTNGTLPGDGFPVFDTEVGRVGCNICMDSSAAESARMVGLHGAEWLLLPIMGDHRADRWSAGPPIFSEDRWRAIQRVRAMDNQLCLVAARNTVTGSCIIDRKGDVLAWNDGDRDHILADVRLDDGYRSWTGGCFRGTNWLQRRPSVYGAATDPANWGGLR